MNFFPSRLMHYSYKKQYPFVFSLDLLSNTQHAGQEAAIRPPGSSSRSRLEGQPLLTPSNAFMCAEILFFFYPSPPLRTPPLFHPSYPRPLNTDIQPDPLSSLQSECKASLAASRTHFFKHCRCVFFTFKMCALLF